MLDKHRYGVKVLKKKVKEVGRRSILGRVVLIRVVGSIRIVEIGTPVLLYTTGSLEGRGGRGLFTPGNEILNLDVLFLMSTHGGRVTPCLFTVSFSRVGDRKGRLPYRPNDTEGGRKPRLKGSSGLPGPENASY